MEKLLRADNLCTDLLYFKNYLISMMNVENIQPEIKEQINKIMASSDEIYKQYNKYSAVHLGKVISDLNKVKEQVSKLHIRASNNKALISRYEELCFYLSESRKIYFSNIAV